MSTYNGGTKIIRQVQTIIDQIGVRTFISIRDDGSNKETIDILKRLEREYSNIDITYGKNVGYKKSFLSLITNCKRNGFDYYAFSDQDDLWEKRKLLKAVQCLDKINDSVKLYVSSLDIYDEHGHFLRKKDMSMFPNNIYSLFTRMRFAGCTFVFSKNLVDLCSNYENLPFYNHDMVEHDFLVAAFAYSFGQVVVDSESYIKHIRYRSSVTSGGNGLKKRMQIEFFNTFKRKNVRKHMANILLNSNGKIVSGEIGQYLELVKEYKKTLKNRIRLIKYINCGSTIGNLESIIKVLIGNF